MAEGPIPVTIVTGFLGAGKSTLLGKWLEELPREETVVIVNERGEVGIDGELLAARVARLREISGGCVCCQTQAELASALDELSESTPRPGRILVETSGAASPAGVIRAIAAPRLAERLRLDGVITVIDATRARRALAFDIAAEQLGFADVVVLSHVDELAEGEPGLELAALQAELQRYAPAAVFVEARRGLVSSSLLELLAQRVETLHLTAPSEHASIQAVSLVVAGELDEERFGDWVESALGNVAARLLRLKGILAMQGVDARVIVQGVGDAVDVELGAPWDTAARTSRMVVLGLGLDAAALEAGFAECAVKDLTPR
jgi:G3E family GTPase